MHNQLLNITASFKDLVLAFLIAIPFSMALLSIVVKHAVKKALEEIEKDK